ncbi:hypothetical protein ACSBR2_012454 [Camellia fascicularis]
MMDSSYNLNKEIAIVVSLFVFGTLSIVLGIIMTFNRVDGDTAHGIFFAILELIMFILGFYYRYTQRCYQFSYGLEIDV